MKRHILAPEDVAGNAGQEEVVLVVELQIEDPVPKSKRIKSFRIDVEEAFRNPELSDQLVRNFGQVTRTLKVQVSML